MPNSSRCFAHLVRASCDELVDERALCRRGAQQPPDPLDADVAIIVGGVSGQREHVHGTSMPSLSARALTSARSSPARNASSRSDRGPGPTMTPPLGSMLAAWPVGDMIEGYRLSRNTPSNGALLDDVGQRSALSRCTPDAWLSCVKIRIQVHRPAPSLVHAASVCD
jgi:hypothetical protein